MTANPDPEARLDQAILEYLQAEDSGKPLPIPHFLARFPDIESELRSFLADRGEVVRELNTPASGADQATRTQGSRSSGIPELSSFGDYELGELIARGGMGAIYLAYHRPLKRSVAIKILLADPRTSPTLVRRFMDEAQIASQLQHPGIAPVHDIGEAPDGRPFFAMKLIKGRTLADLLAERTSPSSDGPRFLSIFDQVAQTVAYAHSKGVIHRDLKPLNIMVGAFGEVQVMDWGLAKVLGEQTLAPAPKADDPHSAIESDRSDDSGTQAGAIMGTLAYMPPEQARGEIEAITRRADVFSLGALLCEILTGLPPYTGTREEVRAYATLGHVQQAIERLDQSGADAELIALAKHCLKAAPADRPPNAGAVSQTVKQHLDATQEKLRQAEIERARVEVRQLADRRRRRLQIGMAVSAALLLILVGGVWFQKQAQRSLKLEQTRRAVDVAITKAEQKRIESKQINTGANKERALQALGKASEALELARRAEETFALGIVDEQLRDHVQGYIRDLEIEEQEATERVAQAEREIRFLDELSNVRYDRYQPVAKPEKKVEPKGTPLAVEQPQQDAPKASYDKAFQILGIHALTWPATQVAQKIQSLPTGDVREQATLALYAWSENVSEPERKKLDAILDTCETDAWRIRYRQAIRSKQKVQTEQLVAEAFKVRLPAPAYLLLSRKLDQPPRRRELLNHASLYYPEDSFISEALADSIHPHRSWRNWSEKHVSDSVRSARQRAHMHYLAALAGRPESIHLRCRIAECLPTQEALAWVRANLVIFRESARLQRMLGDVLQVEDPKSAAACYRKAFELDPSPPYLERLARATEDHDGIEAKIRLLREVVKQYAHNAWSHNALGNALREISDFDGAFASYRKAVEIEPRELESYHGQAECYRGKKDAEGEVRVFRELVERDPTNAQAHARLADNLNEKTDWQGAVASYRRATELAPDAHYWQPFTKALIATGDWTGALRIANRFASNDPESFWAHDLLGDEAKNKGNIEEALIHYRRAIELRPDRSSFPGLETALQLKGNSQYTRSFWTSLIEMHPSVSEYHLQLGLFLHAIGERESARVRFRKAATLTQPGSAGFMVMRNKIIGVGEAECALQILRDEVRRNPDDEYTWSVLARNQEETGDVEGAIASFRKVVELDPTSYYFSNYVELLKKNGGITRTRSQMEELISRIPTHASAHHQLAKILDEIGDIDGAIDSHREAYRLERRRVFYEFDLAEALLVRGDKQEALEVLRSIKLGNNRNEGFSYTRRGEVYIKAGELDEGILHLKRGFELDPGWYGLHELEDAISQKKGKGFDRITVLKELLKQYPNIAVVHYELGTAYANNSAWPEAFAAFSQAIRMKPDDDFFWINLPSQLESAGPNLKGQFYRDLVESFKTDAVRLDTLAWRLMSLKRTDEAIAAYKQSLQLRPRVDQSDSVADLKLERDDDKFAVRIMREGIKRLPDDSSAHFRYGEILIEVGRPTDALAPIMRGMELSSSASEIETIAQQLSDKNELVVCYSLMANAIGRFPGDVRAWQSYGNVAHQIGQHHEALLAILRAIDLGSLALHHYFGSDFRILMESLKAIDDSSLIEETYRNLAVKYPTNPKLLYCIGQNLREHGLFGAAIEVYQQALSQEPDQNEYYQLAQIHIAAGNLQEAVQVARTGVEKFPGKADAHIHLGEILSNSGDLKGAIPVYQKAAELDPKSNALANLARLYSQEKDHAAAYDLLKKAITRDPEHLGNRSAFVEACLRLKKYDEAMPVLLETIRLSQPTSGWSYSSDLENLKSLLKKKNNPDLTHKTWVDLVGKYPGDTDIQLQWASHLEENRKDITGAIAVYLKLVESVPVGGDLLPELARLQTLNKDYIPAIDSYRKLRDGDERKFEGINKTLKAKGDAAYSVTVFSELANKFPKNNAVARYLGHWQIMNGDLTAGRKSYRKGLEQPGQGLGLRPYSEFASSLLQAEQFGESFSVLREWMEVERDNSYAFSQYASQLDKCKREHLSPKYRRQAAFLYDEDSVDSYAEQLLRAGKREEALAFHRELVQQDPENIALHFRLGDLCTKLKLYPEAEEAFRAALNRGPDSTSGWLGLAEAFALSGEPLRAMTFLEQGMSSSNGEFHLAAAKYAVLAAERKWRVDRTGLRSKALRWLTELRAEMQRTVDEAEDDTVKHSCHDSLQECLTEPVFSLVRDRINELPAGEQQAWKDLWASVRQLHSATKPPPEIGPVPRLLAASSK